MSEESKQSRMEALGKAFDETEKADEAPVGPVEAASDEPATIEQDDTEVVSEAPTEPVEATEDDRAPVAEQKPASSAPQSWKNEVKAEWDKLPPTVQAEVMRRESENARILQESSQARHLVGEMQKIVAPYQQMFQAQGVDPLVGISNTLQIASALQSGDTNAKAHTVARLIKEFGVDIQALDGILAGSNSYKPQQPAIDPELQQKLTRMEQYIAMQEQMQAQTYQTETQKFLADNPMANEVRSEMADFMDFWQAKGRNLTLMEAYNMAIATRPELMQRSQQQQTVSKSQDKLAQSRAASVSIPQRAEPPAGKVAPTSRRAALEEAMGG